MPSSKNEAPQQPKKQRKNKAPDHAWKPGQSGNPNGRPPKGYSITEMMKSMLASEPATKQKIGQTILKLAQAGDVPAIKMLWQYMDGMPIQKVEGDLTVNDVRNPDALQRLAESAGFVPAAGQSNQREE